MGLVDDLSVAWKAPRATMRTPQRLVRALIAEIMADVDEAALVIRWKGGHHCELQVRRRHLPARAAWPSVVRIRTSARL